MRLVDDVSIRRESTYCLQECPIGPDTRRPELQRSIGLDLPHHQDNIARARGAGPRSGTHVVLCQAGADNRFAQLPRTRQRSLVKFRTGQQTLEIRASGRIVVDATAIKDPRHRPNQLRPQTHRA
ncbi:hypothetical protein D9M70_567790 [compost metagenome]